MFEKLLLAVTITFSLNLFLQFRLPNEAKTGANQGQHRQAISTIVVRMVEK
ncbi:MAG: hypothetical protein HC908_16155 [Calothrix sp. SM1_7_51]|nr:hypothetical protein [Calothrix sp. SM1_7_51]